MASSDVKEDKLNALEEALLLQDTKVEGKERLYVRHAKKLEMLKSRYPTVTRMLTASGEGIAAGLVVTHKTTTSPYAAKTKRTKDSLASNSSVIVNGTFTRTCFKMWFSALQNFNSCHHHMRVFLLVWVKTSLTWCHVLNCTLYNYFRAFSLRLQYRDKRRENSCHRIWNRHPYQRN